MRQCEINIDSTQIRNGLSRRVSTLRFYWDRSGFHKQITNYNESVDAAYRNLQRLVRSCAIKVFIRPTILLS